MSTSSGGTYSTPPVDESGIYQTEWTGGPAAKQPAGGGAGGSSGSAASSPGFQVDSDAVRAQAAILAECGDEIAQILTSLRGTLSGGGEPWGTDDLGQQFGPEYTGPANQGFASLAGLGTALANVANQLVAQADSYDELEEQLSGTISQIAQPDGTGSSGSAGSAGAGS